MRGDLCSHGECGYRLLDRGPLLSLATVNVAFVQNLFSFCLAPDIVPVWQLCWKWQLIKILLY
jgi:hypothetical protein